MATLEPAPRPSRVTAEAPASLTVTIPRSPSSLGLAPPASPTIVRTATDAFVLPAAPTHEPEDDHLPPPLPPQAFEQVQPTARPSSLNLQPRSATPAGEDDERFADEEEEEVLEELRDENEDLHPYGLHGRTDLGSTLSAVQTSALLALQTLLQSMLTNATTQSEAPVTAEQIETLLEAAELLSAKRATTSESAAAAPLLRLNALLDRLPHAAASAAAPSTTLADDVNLATALGALLSSLENVRSPAVSMRVDSPLGSRSSLDGILPARPGSSQQIRTYTPGSPHGGAASFNWQTRREGSVGHGSATVASSPSASRENLRDPFAETSETEQDVFATLQSLMASLAVRCAPHATAPSSPMLQGSPSMSGRASPLLWSATSPSSAPPIVTSPTTISSAVGGGVASSTSTMSAPPLGATATMRSSGSGTSAEDRESLASWNQLSHLLSITRELVAARRAHSAASLSREASLSPTRARSRRGSSASGSGSIGDASPVVPATAEEAKAQSRLSVQSNGSTAAATAAASTTNLTDKGTPRSLSARERSDSAGRNASSAPPRYSEESARLWGAGLPGVQGEGTASPPLREKRDSMASSSNASVLPAYPSFGAAAQYGAAAEKATDEKRDASAATPSTATAAAAARIRSPSAGAEYVAREYAARTSQDLKLVQSSIDRLYNAVPQLSNQRATLSLNPKSLRDVNVQEVVERLGRTGRMEDQRAAPPVARPRTPGLPPPASASASGAAAAAYTTTATTGVSSAETSEHGHGQSGSLRGSKTSLGRRFSVGDKLGGKLQGLRRAAEASLKGKARDMTGTQSVDMTTAAERQGSPPPRSELLPLFDDIQMAKEMSFDNQRVELKPRPPKQRPSKLALMGIGNDALPTSGRNSVAATDADDDDEDDALFAMLGASSSRMAGQDAPLRPRSKLSASTNGKATPFESSNAPTPTSATYDSQFTSEPASASGLVEAQRASLGESADAGGRVMHSVASDKNLGDDDDDARRVRYLAEGQRQLGVVSVLISMLQHNNNRDDNEEKESYIYTHPAPLHYATSLDDTHDLSLSSSTRTTCSFLALTHESLGTKPTLLRLPVPVAAGQTGQATLMGDHYLVKLQASHNDMPTTAPSPPLSAAHLQNLQPAFFSCDGCNKPIIRSVCSASSVTSGEEAKTSYRALPSQHWEELVDAWMCHDDQVLNVNVTRGREGMMEGRTIAADECWVGDASVAWPAVRAVEGAVRLRWQEKSGETLKRNVWSISCSHCSLPLGYMVPNLDAATSSPLPLDGSVEPAFEQSSVKLLKSALRPAPAIGAPATPSLLYLLVASELYQLSQAHAARHFLLEAQNEDGVLQPRAMLWLFLSSYDVALSPSSSLESILHGQPTSGSQGIALSACKILYRTPTPSELATYAAERAAEATQQQVVEPAWSSPTSVERVRYAARTCERIMMALHASNSALPPSRRTFGEWNVGFLQMQGE